MSAELKEALRQVTNEQIEYQPGYFVWQMETEVRDVIEQAARRVAEADEVWWCQSQMNISAFGRPHWCRGMGHNRCGGVLMVVGRLLLPAEEGD